MKIGPSYKNLSKLMRNFIGSFILIMKSNTSRGGCDYLFEHANMHAQGRYKNQI